MSELEKAIRAEKLEIFKNAEKRKRAEMEASF